MMQHYVSLTINESDFDDQLLKKWFRLVTNNIPTGLPTSVNAGDSAASMQKKKAKGKIALIIPLTRDLTDNETKHLVSICNAKLSGDFSIKSSKIVETTKDEFEINIPETVLIELCTEWAKKDHNEWMKSKIDSGWRYGSNVSAKEKTHPLLRQWSDLPDQHRKIDVSKAEELVKLFNEYGYLFVPKSTLKN